jgi:hypothetical protein
MHLLTTRRAAVAPFVALISLIAATTSIGQQPGSESRMEAQTPAKFRADRTAAEMKLDSGLMLAVRDSARRQFRGSSAEASPLEAQSFVEANGTSDETIALSIWATVSAGLAGVLRALGSGKIREFPQYDNMAVRLPYAALMAIAECADVPFVGPIEREQVSGFFPPAKEIAAMRGSLGKTAPKAGNAPRAPEESTYGARGMSIHAGLQLAVRQCSPALSSNQLLNMHEQLETPLR